MMENDERGSPQEPEERSPGPSPSTESLMQLAAAGEDIPADLLDAWRREREARHAALCGLESDRARRAIGDELRRIEERVEALEEGAGGKPGERVPSLFELGERIRWELRAVDSLAGETALDPFSLVEEEIGWVRRSALDLRRWDRSLQEAADDVLARVEKARAEVALQKLRRFAAERSAPPAEASPLETASRAWLRISESFLIEGELLSRGTAGRDAKIVKELSVLRGTRADLRDACAAALRAADPVEFGQFLRQAVADLVDTSSVVVSERSSGRLEESVRSLALLSERIDALFSILGEGPRKLRGNGRSPQERKRVRGDLKRLARLRRRTRTARLEAETDLRMQRALGPRVVRFAENLLFILLLAFLGLVVVEWRLPESSPHIATIHRIDIVLCALFQIDFFTRWGFARWRGSYFLRHFFIESLPALPYGIIFHHLRHAYGFGAAGEARAVIAVRILRSRSVFLLLLRATRVFRLLVFFLRGSDRAVERLRGVLDRDVVLFEPGGVGDADGSSARGRLLALEARRQKLLRAAYADLPADRRCPALAGYARILPVESEVVAHGSIPHRPGPIRAAREIRLEEVVRRLLDCDAASVAALLGYRSTHRVARWLRLLDVPLVRSLPVVRRLVPAGRTSEPPEAVAAAARALGEILQNVLGAFRFRGDLEGITTGPQVLDRLASTIIAATKRPAFRLLSFAGLFLLAKGLLVLSAEILGVELNLLKTAFGAIVRILGWPLLILGSVCLVLFLTGRWLKRIAGEALDVYLRTADAHFYGLAKRWKARRADGDLRAIFRSVFGPELKLRAGADVSEDRWIRFLGSSSIGELSSNAGELSPDARDPSSHAGALFQYAEDRKVVALLYRDFLDGPILHRLDDKTSVQLLGNLVVQEIRVQTLRLTRKDIRRLERLDLAKDRIITIGPYFWFRLVTESLAIETAKLVMEYNASCIPLGERHLARPEAVRRFDAFLAVRRGRWGRAAEARAASALGRLGEPLSTRSFTAVDFLDRDPCREEETEALFGEDVLRALREDRRNLIREIFGTRPYHLLPRAQRVFNPYALYRRHVAGFRVFCLPLTLGARAVLFSAGRVARLVGEVLGRAPDVESRLPRTAGFDVAARKLNRLRKPFFVEALRLRAALDVEYLGLRLPGFPRDPDGPSYEKDLESIGAPAADRTPIDRLRDGALTDLRRFRAFLADRGWLADDLGDFIGGLDPSGDLLRHRGEVVRALVTAFVTDQASIRTRLTAPERFRELVEVTLGDRLGLWRRAARGIVAAVRRRTSGGRGRLARLAEYLDRVGEYRDIPPPLGRKLKRAILCASSEVARTLDLALDHVRRNDAGRDALVEDLARVARDYPAWTRRIVTVRALQAITVLDLRSYRDLVYELGEYGGRESGA